MNLMMRNAAPLAALIATMVGCAATESPRGEKWFNQDQFVGLKMFSSSYDRITLSYELDAAGGELASFDSCMGVENTKESDIVQSQFPLFRKLQINCLGAKLFHDGAYANRSFLSNDLSSAVAREFPSTVVPNQGGTSLEPESGEHLADMESLKFISAGNNTLQLKIGATEIDYVLLAEADVNRDGYQDWILRLDWAQVDSFGEGTDLIVLTRKSEDGEIEVLQRYPK